MSKDVRGGIDYALLKQHYDADDYVSLKHPTTGLTLLNGIPFTATETYYIPGLMAYLHDKNVFDIEKGWILYTHGQPAAPAYLLPFLTALGLAAWPPKVAAFEAKKITFLATEDCWIRFEGASRVRHFIPGGALVTGPYFTYTRRCNIFFVVRDTTNGILYVWITG